MDKNNIKRSVGRFWIEWRTLIFFLCIMAVFRSAIADWNQVPTGSMKPTILEGDRVVVNKVAYDLKIPFTSWQIAQWNHPSRGEIVTFHSPAEEKLLIKRVIGVPGDTVAMRNNQLYINGERATYRRLADNIVNQVSDEQRKIHTFLLEQHGESQRPVMVLPSPPNEYNSFAPVKIPMGQYLMLGDNRDDSADSRFIGLIERDRIEGRAHTVAFSVNYEAFYLPRTDRFLRTLD